MIDLHVHSTASDGSLTPRELVYYAAEKQLSAIALTDHDTVSGLAEAIAASHHAGIELIPGVEMSCVWEGTEIHILGYFVDTGSPALQDGLSWFRRMRDERNETILDNLAEDGILLTEEELRAGDPDTVITRAHFAQYMLEKGFISSIDEAFRRLIGDDCPFFVPREKISPQYGVQFLLQYGAVPVLAHPMQYKMDDTALCALVSSLCDFGLAGIEVYYSTHKPDDTAYLSRIADRYGLLPSGGSDFHGSRKKNLDLGTGYGHLYVPDTILPPLRAKAAAVNK